MKNKLNLKKQEELDKDKYMLLDRLKMDCGYFIKNPYNKHLWAGNIEDQIKKMKKLWKEIKVKPEWLSLDEINKFEKIMKEKFDQINNKIEFSNEIDLGKYKQFGLIKNNVEVGSIKYRYDNGTLIIDMIKITNEDDRLKGYGTKLFNQLLNNLKPNIIIKIKASEDGFTNDGLEFFESMVYYNKGWKIEKDYNGNPEIIISQI